MSAAEILAAAQMRDRIADDFARQAAFKRRAGNTASLQRAKWLLAAEMMTRLHPAVPAQEPVGAIGAKRRDAMVRALSDELAALFKRDRQVNGGTVFHDASSDILRLEGGFGLSNIASALVDFLEQSCGLFPIHEGAAMGSAADEPKGLAV